MNKKVTFAPNVKKHDGTKISFKCVIFYQIVCGFFKIKFMDFKERIIENSEDRLETVSFDSELLRYIINRLKNFRKLLYEKNIELMSEEPLKNNNKIEDYYWDNNFFNSRIKKSGSRVSLVRKGSRDFGLSFECEHINDFNKLIYMCEQSLEKNDNPPDWFIIEDYI
jgi:hypothetical protein